MILTSLAFVTKNCGRCFKEKPVDRFHRRGKKRQAWCKDCRRSYDAEYHSKVRERRLEQKKAYDLAFRRWARDLKAGKPCADCAGIFPPAAMQWDHLPGSVKEANPGDLARRHCRRKLLEEIKKCELVCANCHAVRTLRRAGA